MSKSKSKEKKPSDMFYKWSKSEELAKQFAKERNLSWYEKRYKRNLNLSLSLVVFSLIIASFASYNIKRVADQRMTFITSTSGEVVHYKMTEEKRMLLNKAMKAINEKRNK